LLCVDAEGDVVAGDGFLAGDGGDGDLHVDFGEPRGEGVDPGQAWFAEAGQCFAEAEDDAFFVLGDDFEAEHAGRPIPRRGAPGVPGAEDGAGVIVGARNPPVLFSL
jgi:hypothetical protein